MFRVLVTDGLREEALDLLSRNGLELQLYRGLAHESLLENAAQFDAIIFKTRTQITREVLESAPRLRLLARAGNGLDNVDLETAKKMQIQVTHTPDESAVSAAEQTVFMILAAARQAKSALKSLEEGQFRNFALKGMELETKVCGVIGFGRIGSRVAKRLKAFGMQIIAYDPYIDTQEVQLVELNELLSQADVVTVHTPLNQETYQMLSYEQFYMMKKGSILVNCARGGIVDEKALLEALQQERLGAAALDVFENEPISSKNPLNQHPRCFCSPHIGARTEEANLRVDLSIAEKVVEFFKSIESIKNKERNVSG